MSLHVFISHSSEDREVAQKVCDLLEKRGLRCWIAPRNITPGREYASEIIDAINDCGALVLVLTENANASKFVAKEVERAVDRERPVIPLRVREVRPGKSLELFISSSHWIDAFTSPMDAKMDQLEAALRPLCQMEAPPPRPEPRPRPQKTASGKPFPKWLPMAAIAAIVVLGIGGWAVLGGSHTPVPEAADTATTTTASPSPTDSEPPTSTLAATTTPSTPDPAPATPTGTAAPLPLATPPIAAESELVNEIAAFKGNARFGPLQKLASRMPDPLSEGGAVALLGDMEDRTRREAIGFLANYMKEPISVAGLDAMARGTQRHDRVSVFESLRGQDLLPRNLSTTDAAQLMRGLDGAARRDAIQHLAPALAAGVNAEGFTTLANPLMSWDRGRALNELVKHDRMAKDLRGADVAVAIRESASGPRLGMIETIAPLLAADQSAADLAALLGPMRGWDRNKTLLVLHNNTRIAQGLAVADAEALMRGETQGPRKAMVETLSTSLAAPVNAEGMALLAGPLTGYDRIAAFDSVVKAGVSGRISRSDIESLAQGLNDAQRRTLVETLGPVLQ